MVEKLFKDHDTIPRCKISIKQIASIEEYIKHVNFIEKKRGNGNGYDLEYNMIFRGQFGYEDLNSTAFAPPKKGN